MNKKLIAIPVALVAILSFALAYAHPPTITTPDMVSIANGESVVLEASHDSDPITWSASEGTVDPCTGDLAGLTAGPMGTAYNVNVTATSQDCNAQLPHVANKTVKVLVNANDVAGYCQNPQPFPTPSCHFSEFYPLTSDPHSATWNNGVQTLNGYDGKFGVLMPDAGEFHNVAFCTNIPSNTVPCDVVDDTVIANSARFVSPVQATPFTVQFAHTDLIELAETLNVDTLGYICEVHPVQMYQTVKVR